MILNESGTRYHYLVPMYEMYLSLFQCEYDYETVDYDPYLNEELRGFYEEIAAFINEPDAVRLELLGNNTVKLCISEDYLNFAEENAIQRFIDLGWMKNAFAVDHIADRLIENNYISGAIMSYDGFMRRVGGE